MTTGIFVTGTDTGVGKTRAACALMRGFAARGLRVAGMKPVAAGGLVATPDGMLNEDVVALRAAATVDAPLDEVNPYCFAEPIAPHIAAARAGIAIDLDVLRARFDALATRSDVVVVEGAGGFLVPLDDHRDFGDLAQLLALPVVLVVGVKLGCINHALLTQAAIRGRGLVLAGWIANRIDPAMDSFDDNVESLRARLDAPLLATMAWAPDGDGELAIGLPGT